MLNNDALKITLVDDDPFFLSALRNEIEQVFTGRKIRINSYSNSETFFRNIEEDQPSIVILDYDLNSKNRASMNGDEILKLIKDNYPRTEVIMSTGVNRTKIAREMLQNGAIDYVEKDEEGFSRLDYSILSCMRLIELREERDHFRTLAILLGILSVFLLSVIFFT